MSVIVLILKIIGWILLTLLAIFLLIVFLVLFVPVRYRMDGSIEENIRVQGKVHWLLHILTFDFSYNEEGFSYTLKLFGKRIALGEKLEDEEEEAASGKAVHEAGDPGASRGAGTSFKGRWLKGASSPVGDLHTRRDNG